MAIISRDAFEIFDVDARPVVDVDKLAELFYDRVASLHPDHRTGDLTQFREWNGAYRVLVEPASRLDALLARRGLHSAPAVPPEDSLEIFTSVGRAVQQADRCMGGNTKRNGTALVRAISADQKREAFVELAAVRGRLNAWRMQLDKELKALDEKWPEVDDEEMQRLQSSYRFCDSWLWQIEDRIFRLSSREA